MQVVHLFFFGTLYFLRSLLKIVFVKLYIQSRDKNSGTNGFLQQKLTYGIRNFLHSSRRKTLHPVSSQPDPVDRLQEEGRVLLDLGEKSRFTTWLTGM